ncbi:ras-related protein Rab-20-like [Ornithodoros turicata]|uniref:ras-related protein Rab-20-like n=1 Tax=Ornithodoros turicata TaxID=34597 RepID=UPI003139B26C
MRTRLQGADMKVVVLGDVNIGKTTLLIRYMEKRFESKTSATVGATFTVKSQDNNNIAIWDTAGQERYCGLSSFYCRNADVAILAFDITNRESYHALINRYLQLMSTVNGFPLKVLVGTKSDLLKEKRRQVTMAEAQQFASNINPSLPAGDIPYFETSSVTGVNVEKVFEYIFDHCCTKKIPISCCLNASPKERVKLGLTAKTISIAHTAASCCIY